LKPLRPIHGPESDLALHIQCNAPPIRVTLARIAAARSTPVYAKTKETR
jgi:hypothetical protein